MLVILTQAPASATTVVWTGVVSGFIGGLAAVTGVLITQRSARANAHADRIWAERASAYAAAFRWATEWRVAYLDAAFEDDRPKRPPALNLTPDDYFLMYLYGSPKVIGAYEAVGVLHNTLTLKDEISIEDHRKVLEAMDRLKTVIQYETQGLQEPRVPTGRRSIGRFIKVRPK